MKILQEIFESQIQKYWSVERIGAKLIEHKMKALGVNPTPKQIAEKILTSKSAFEGERK